MADHYRAISHSLIDLINKLNESADGLDREQLRYVMNQIQRASLQVCTLIDQEIIRELKDARKAMSEHGFTGDPAPKSPRPPATLDEIL